MKPLVDAATAYVPESAWAATPMALYATAGLRMLPEVRPFVIAHRIAACRFRLTV